MAGEVLPELLRRPVPPPQGLEGGDGLLWEPLADGPGGHAPTMVGGARPPSPGPGAHDGPVPDGDAGEEDGLVADPHVVAQDDVPRLSQASVTFPRPAPIR